MTKAATAAEPTRAVALAVRTERLKEFDQHRDSLTPAVRGLKIATADDRQVASALTQRCTTLLKEIDSDFEPIVANAYNLHKSLKAVHTKYRTPVLELRAAIDAEVLRDRREQERLAAAERARIAAEEAEREEERRMARAIEAEEAGETELAEQILEEEAPPIVAAGPAIEKVAGTSIRHSYTYRLDNALEVKPLGEVRALLARIEAKAASVAIGEVAGGNDKKRACEDIAAWAKEALRLINESRDGARVGFLVVDEKEVGKMARASGKKAEQIVGGITVLVNEIVAH